MPNSPIPVPSLPSTTPVIDSQIPLEGPVADADGSSVAVLSGFTREAIGVQEPAFGPAKVALVSSPSSTMTIPSDAASRNMARFAVELLICPGKLGSEPGRLIESQSTPFSLSLEAGSVAGSYSLTASVHLQHLPTTTPTTGWQSVSAGNVAKLGDWLTVALVWDGDALSLFVDGKLVARRVFRAAALVPLASVTSTDFFVGTWVDKQRNRFVGKLAGVRVWSDVPAKLLAALRAGEAAGVGAITSRHADLGGASGSLGAVRSSEQPLAGGRWQSFDKGVITWRADTGARVIAAPLHTLYVTQRVRDNLGLPIEDERVVAGVRVQSFEKGALHHGNATGTSALWGPTYLRHRTSLAKLLGAPKSATPQGTAQYPDMYTQFERGRIYYAAHLGAFEVHGLIHEHYSSLGGPTGLLGFPVSDEEAVRSASGAEIGRVSVFEKGAIYFCDACGAHEVHGRILDAYRKLGGPASALGFPISDELGAQNGVRYGAFQNGVIVWRNGWSSAKAISEVELRVETITAGKIDDGDESTAELYSKVTIEANGQPIAKQKRFPGSGHVNATVTVDTNWVIPIRHDTAIALRIDVWDWDAASDDDYHGRIEQRYDIHSLWGMLSSDPALDGEIGLWTKQPLTTKTSDTPKLTSIQFSYRFSARSQKVDPDRFREQGWWSFANFSTPLLSKAQFTEAFSDVDAASNAWETILNPLDTLFYELGFKGAASGGNCFGMSAEALRALQGNSLYSEYIYRFQQSHAASTINVRQGQQLSSPMFHHVIRNLGNLDLLEPIDVFETLRHEIDARGACIVSMMNLANMTGHAVLAYRYEVGGPGNRHGCLYVADPNLPWSQATKHPSTIEVFKDNSFKATTITTRNNPQGFASNPIDLGIARIPTTLMMAVPYRLVATRPTSPIWDIVATVLSLGTYLLFAGDAAVEQVSVGSDALFETTQAGSTIDRNHPLRPLALFDHAKPPTMLGATSRLAAPLTLELRGRQQGSYEQGALLGSAGFHLRNSIGAGARDLLRVEEPGTAFPLVSLDVDAATKEAQLNYIVARDPSERPARSFSFALQQAKGDVARVGVDARGGALMVSPGGAPKPFDIACAVVDAAGKLRSSVLRGVIATSGPEVLRIVPDDWQNPLGNFAIERLSSLSGGVLERKAMRGS